MMLSNPQITCIAKYTMVSLELIVNAKCIKCNIVHI